MVDGDKLWMSYYSEGVLVYDITDPTTPNNIGQKDTSTYDSGFHGVWGIFPYTNEENVAYASDIESGLWVLKLVGEETPSTTPSTIPTAQQSPSSSISAPVNVSFTNSTYYINSTEITNGTTADNDTLLWIGIGVGVALAVVAIILGAVVVGYFVYKKRVAYTTTTDDDFSGRVDDEDLF